MICWKKVMEKNTCIQTSIHFFLFCVSFDYFFIIYSFLRHSMYQKPLYWNPHCSKCTLVNTFHGAYKQGDLVLSVDESNPAFMTFNQKHNVSSKAKRFFLCLQLTGVLLNVKAVLLLLIGKFYTHHLKQLFNCGLPLSGYNIFLLLFKGINRNGKTLRKPTKSWQKFDFWGRINMFF